MARMNARCWTSGKPRPSSRRRCCSYIHGGGWVSGDKFRMSAPVCKRCWMRGSRWCPSTIAIPGRPSLRASSLQWKPRCMTQHVLCNSCAARPRNGTSTKAASVRAAVPQAPAHHSGWRCTTTWRITKAKIPWLTNPRDSGRFAVSRRADVARSQGTQGMDPKQPVWRSRLRLHGSQRYQVA